MLAKGKVFGCGASTKRITPDEKSGLAEYEFKLVGSVDAKLSYGPTKLIPNVLKQYVTAEIYVKPSIDLEFIGSIKYQKLNGTGNTKLDKANSGIKAQLVGGIGIGATFKVDAGKAFHVEADASGKAEIECSVGRNLEGKVPFVINAKPLVFSFTAAVKLGDIDVVNYNFIRNITNETELYKNAEIFEFKK